jgi:hypothetical protein
MKKHSLTILLLITGLFVVAQRRKPATDTLTPFREFSAVSNLYKKIPLYLNLDYTKTTTFPVEEEDTISTSADFYLTTSGTYIRFGNLEQVANDSFLLMVSTDQQAMLLFANEVRVQDQFKNYMGFQMNDSNVIRMATQYTAAFLPAEGDTGLIEIRHRLPLPGTEIIKETIILKYHRITKYPFQIVHSRKSLISLDKEDWSVLENKAELQKQLLEINNHYFLLNERKAEYRYRKISNTSDIKLPVIIGDRIIRNENGEFIPAKGFEHYSVTTNDN